MSLDTLLRVIGHLKEPLHFLISVRNFPERKVYIRVSYSDDNLYGPMGREHHSIIRSLHPPNFTISINLIRIFFNYLIV